MLRQTGPGEVLTYGEVAALAGRAGAARAVGRVMAASSGLPWWRVVAANGRLVPGHEQQQAERLTAEGVSVVNGRCVLSRRVGTYVRGRGGARRDGERSVKSLPAAHN